MLQVSLCPLVEIERKEVKGNLLFLSVFVINTRHTAIKGTIIIATPIAIHWVADPLMTSEKSEEYLSDLFNLSKESENKAQLLKIVTENAMRI